MNENIPSVAELEVQAKAWFEEEHDYDCPWQDMASFAHHILTSQTQRGTDRICECGHQRYDHLAISGGGDTGPWECFVANCNCVAFGVKGE